MAHVIEGNWKCGWALDLHTIRSIPLGDGKFENTYSDVGQSLYNLKYCNQHNEIEILANYLIAFLTPLLVRPYLDVIVPAPASKERDLQPVYAVAKMVSEKMGIPYDDTYIQKIKNTGELKTIESPQERAKLLNDAFSVTDLYKNKKILIIDDLFRSGSTLKELTKTMYNTGQVNNVYVVTLTKTRVHR